MTQLSRLLRLSVVQELAFSVALLYSKTGNIKAQAATHIKRKVPAFIKLYTEKGKQLALFSNLILLILKRNASEIIENLKEFMCLIVSKLLRHKSVVQNGYPPPIRQVTVALKSIMLFLIPVLGIILPILKDLSK